MQPIFHTAMARKYVNQSPQTKKLPDFAKARLIKGIARLLKSIYHKGYIDGRTLG